MKKIFLDTEFTGLHQKTTLISLATVAESGEEFYAEFTDYDRTQINDWLNKNIISNLWITNNQTFDRSQNGTYLKGDRITIKESLQRWLGQFEGVEIWADVLAYDWVLFCELFGGAEALPENIFYTPFDIATLFRINNYIQPISKYERDIKRFDFVNADQKFQHNSLADARIIKFCFEKIFIQEKSDIMETENMFERLKNYRVDFVYSKGVYFAASKRLKDKYEKKERKVQILNLISAGFSITVLTVLQFYLAEKLDKNAIYIISIFAFVSVIISISLFFYKNPERYIAYHNRAEEYLLLYKQAKDAEAKFTDKLLTPVQLSQEIERLHHAQAKLISVPLETTYEDYNAAKKGIENGENGYTYKDFQNT